jgi:hypothetical protein
MSSASASMEACVTSTPSPRAIVARRIVYSGKNFSAPALPLDPQRQRRLNRVLSTRKPADFDGMPDEIVLLGSEIDLHAINIRS